ncbi:hypothetical protein J3R74_004230 [Puniceicoccus vermicola]
MYTQGTLLRATGIDTEGRLSENPWNLGKKEGRGLPQNRAPFSFLLYCYPNLPLREKVLNLL